MEELALPIVLCVLIKNNKILLIKRENGHYSNLWGLPGGKIKKEEHLSEAAIREAFEETNLPSDFKEHIFTISEHLIEHDQINQHFLLNICKLTAKSDKIANSQEGEASWFDLEILNSMKNKIIPSDFMIIQKIIKNENQKYFDSIIEKVGAKYILKKFE